jgi:hypothetical protein
MPDPKINEDGPAGTESIFESVTRVENIATANGYSQNSCGSKQIALTVETLREPHDGGWHGRYVLHTPCQIIGGAA